MIDPLHAPVRGFCGLRFRGEVSTHRVEVSSDVLLTSVLELIEETFHQAYGEREFCIGKTHRVEVSG
jgi:hypothetical protein